MSLRKMETASPGNWSAAVKKQSAAAASRLNSLHRDCTTLTRAFGASPNISGAYSASTRLGGKAKSPTLFRRTVYSMVTVPLGEILVVAERLKAALFKRRPAAAAFAFRLRGNFRVTAQAAAQMVAPPGMGR